MRIELEGHPELAWETADFFGASRNVTTCLCSLFYVIRPEEVAPLALLFMQGAGDLKTKEIANALGITDRPMRARLEKARNIAAALLAQRKRGETAKVKPRADLLALKTPDPVKDGEGEA